MASTQPMSQTIFSAILSYLDSFTYSFISKLMSSVRSIIQMKTGFPFIWTILRNGSIKPIPSSDDDFDPLEPAATFKSRLEAFLTIVKPSLNSRIPKNRLMDISNELVKEYQQKLLDSDICMLPSYTTTLPTGKEKGEYLALDIGGSTLRIALVQLLGIIRDKTASQTPLKICKVQIHPIRESIRALEGVAFFDWVATRIKQFVTEHCEILQDGPVQIGMAWSFPIQQTSPRSGNILAMGKGFRASQGTEGRDLGDLISQACARIGCAVELRAIVNDGDATLLAQAYVNPATRLSLVVGTGTNAAVLLPLLQLSDTKTAGRRPSWSASATSVLVNTEVSMFGKQSLPVSKWDRQLNETHALPDFQPLEYLTTGRYLGEIVRLIVVDAISTVGLICCMFLFCRL